jgi:acetyl-CoA acetyltransferase
VTRLTRDVAVVGVGYSTFSRHGDPDPRRLALDSARAALADAGLTSRDVDAMFHFRFEEDVPVAELARSLGIQDLAVWTDIKTTGPSGLGAVLSAVMAVASGAAETALAFRAITRSTGTTGKLSDDDMPARQAQQYLFPFGWGAGVLPGIAMRKARRIYELGDTEEAYGQIALNARRWAKDNDRAVLREELTMDDYLSSRQVVEPLRLLDCDYPINGAVSVIVTTAERARDLRQKPVLVDAMAYGSGNLPDTAWCFGGDHLFGGTIPCARRLWERSSVTVEDIDVAQLYDGFTHLTISWIEALGFCGIGEFADWVDGGRRIGPGGSTPVNTSGGHLAEGRGHGVQFLSEAVLQLRGECGVRQIPDAKVAVVTNGGANQCGAMVLTV